MRQDLSRLSDSPRKGPRAARPHHSERKPLAYDRHGDLVELDDLCGATAVPVDQLSIHAMRWLAR